MICTRCLRRLVLARGAFSRPSASGRNFTTTHTIRSETRLGPPAPTSSTTSTSSTPFTNPPSTSTPSAAKLRRPKSKTVVGMVIKGIRYLKAEDLPIAGEDDEYPDWLWGLLDKEGGNSEAGKEGDLFSKSKKQRRIAAKTARKASLDPSSQIVKIPYEHQTIDLPVAESQAGGLELNEAGGERGWEEAQRAREKLTRAMRKGRRKSIKESNFLKSMK